MSEGNDDLPDDVEKVALELSDKVLAWAQNPETTFANPSEQKAALYQTIHANAQAWETPRPCIYKGCAKQSIKRSHTIQRSASLKAIAEGGHVLRPKAYPGKGVQVDAIGLNDASTFAGFCEEHEGLFAEFETTGVIATDRDLALQAYRSICREIVRKQFDIDVLAQSITRMKARVSRLAEGEAKRLGIDLKGVEIEGGPIGPAETWLKAAKSTLSDLEAMHSDVFGHLNGEPESEAGSALRAYKIDVVVPVALSGFGMLNAAGAHLPCVIGIVPTTTETLIYLVTQAGRTALLDAYFDNIDHRLILLDRIETWMTRGSDHWFIRPSVWNAIPAHRQEKVIEALADTSVGIEAELPVSIFDDLRKSAIADQKAAGIPEHARAYLEQQEKKLL